MIRILIVICLIPFFAKAQSNELINLPTNSDINILYAGDYKKGELDIKILEKEWWGLYETNNTSFLKKVKFKLEKIEPDIQYDWEYRLSVEESENCIILISGLKLKDNNFEYFTSRNVLRENQDFTFEFGPYHTFLSSKLENHHLIGEAHRKDYSIHLNYESNEETISQELFLFPSYGQNLNISLIWAGDLDGDGKTDFLIDIPTQPYNEIGYSTGLYLSSKADANKLVKLVAYHTQTGC